MPTLPLSVSEKKKLSKPNEEIGNLKMDLNMCTLMISKYNMCKLNICILMISKYNICKLNILRIHISYFRGHDMMINFILSGLGVFAQARSDVATKSHNVKKEVTD